MFKGRSHFKVVPCPRNKACDVLNCIFGHEDIDLSDVIAKVSVPDSHNSPWTAFASLSNPWAAVQTPKSISINSSEDDEEEEVKEGDKKRIKLYDGSKAAVLQHQSTESSTRHETKHNQPISTSETNIPHVPHQKSLFPSLPLLSLSSSSSSASSLGVATSNSIKKSSSTDQKSATKSAFEGLTHKQASIDHKTTPPSFSTTPKKLPPSPAKPELLFPRTVRNNPAPFTTRMGLLRILHTEIVRVNKELLVQSKNKYSKASAQSPQNLIKLALDEEEKACTQHPPEAYNSVIGYVILGYKKMGRKDGPDESNPGTKVLLKKLQTSGFRVHLPPSPPRDKTINSIYKQDPELVPVIERKLLSRLFLTHVISEKLGYIMEPPDDNAMSEFKAGPNNSRKKKICYRCRTTFDLPPEIEQPSEAELVEESDVAVLRAKAETGKKSCRYHWGRFNWKEKKGMVAYLCCQQAQDAEGCSTHDSHVFESREPAHLATVLQFEPTPENADIPKDKAVALDCEMGYTTNGLELIRLSAFDWPLGRTLVDFLVKPYGEVLDFNPRFSGVDQGMFDAAIPLPTDWKTSKKSLISTGKRVSIAPNAATAREILFSFISPSTPIIGHSLENDMKTLRIIHPTLVDTCVIFPPQGGFSRVSQDGHILRGSLKQLARDHLGRAIQSDAAGGHDSKEDALAAGDLVRHKVKELWKMMKADGWKIDAEKGEFVPCNEYDIPRSLKAVSKYLQKPGDDWW